MVRYKRTGKDIDRGLVGYWPLNDKRSGSSVAIDLAKFNDGTISGVTNTTGINGLNADAMFFDGVDDKVECPSGTFDITETNEITISTWVWADSDRGGTSTFTGIIGETGSYTRWGLILENSGVVGLSVFKGTADPGDRLAVNTAAPINDEEWTHIVASYNRVTGDMKIYVNGVLNNTQAQTPTDLFTDSTNLRIGGNGSSLAFHGRIQKTRLYNRPLTDGEASKLYRLKL